MPSLPLYAWLGLTFAFVLMGTCVLKVLAGVTRRQIEIHDLVYKSKQIRQQYIEAVLKRRAMGGDAELIEE